MIWREPWTDADGDSKCQQCFTNNPIWWVAHDLWNEVMGSDGGILCPTCFMMKADAQRCATGQPLHLWNLVDRRE